jgi:hypothetical protein
VRSTSSSWACPFILTLYTFKNSRSGSPRNKCVLLQDYCTFNLLQRQICFFKCCHSTKLEWKWHFWIGLGWNQGVTKRFRLSWLTNIALVYVPKCGGRGWLRGLSQWLQLCTWSTYKLWRSNPRLKQKIETYPANYWTFGICIYVVQNYFNVKKMLLNPHFASLSYTLALLNYVCRLWDTRLICWARPHIENSSPVTLSDTHFSTVDSSLQLLYC